MRRKKNRFSWANTWNLFVGRNQRGESYRWWWRELSFIEHRWIKLNRHMIDRQTSMKKKNNSNLTAVLIANDRARLIDFEVKCVVNCELNRRLIEHDEKSIISLKCSWIHSILSLHHYESTFEQFSTSSEKKILSFG